MVKYTSTMMLERGQRGTTTPFFARIQDKQKLRKDRMEAKDRRANNRIQEMVMETNEQNTEYDLVTVQKTIEIVAGEVAHHTKAGKKFSGTPENVRLHSKDQEESAQESSQESQSRTPGEMLPGAGEEKDQEKTADWTVCESAFRRRQRRMAKGNAEALWRNVHRAGEDGRSTRKQNWIKLQKERRSAIYRRRTQCRDHGWHGAAGQGQDERQEGQRTRRRNSKRDDQAVALGKTYTIAMCFQERFMGLMESPSSWKIVKLVFLRKPGRCPEERNQQLQSNSVDIGDLQVVCILYPSALGERKRAWILESLHVGGVDGISCQQFTSDGDEFTTKTLEMAGGKESRLEPWQCREANSKLGHQDGLRWGETKACG